MAITENDWIKTPDGKVQLQVLKGFPFRIPKTSMRPDGIEVYGAPTERYFDPGVHHLDPANPQDRYLLTHTFLARDLADGAVEHPDTTRERLKAEAAAAKIESDRRQQLLAQANATYERTLRHNAAVLDQEQAIADEINTPLNEQRTLKPRGKAAAIQPTDEEINTPLNQLGKGK